MKTCIFGGTFDPPHIGHLLIAQTVFESENFERLIFVPANISPTKKDETSSSPKTRLKMLEISLINNTNFEISDIEIKILSLKILKKINYENLKIFSRKKTKGLASAFLLGLINTSGDIIGWLDSNMGDTAKKFPEMLQKLKGADIVILSRYVTEGKDERNKIRVISSYLLNKFSKLILRSKINDLSSGIFLMKREVLNDVVPVAKGHGEFMMEFLYKAEKKGNKIIEINNRDVRKIENEEINEIIR